MQQQYWESIAELERKQDGFQADMSQRHQSCQQDLRTTFQTLQQDVQLLKGRVSEPKHDMAEEVQSHEGRV